MNSTPFGLSFLNVSFTYRLPLRIWKVCKPDDKNIVSERKYKIQAQFKEEMGLLVDKVMVTQQDDFLTILKCLPK